MAKKSPRKERAADRFYDRMNAPIPATFAGDPNLAAAYRRGRMDGYGDGLVDGIGLGSEVAVNAAFSGALTSADETRA